jgi:hypothetical protein
MKHVEAVKDGNIKVGNVDGLKKIILTAGMSGQPSHVLVVESLDDTYGDIKVAVLPHIDLPRISPLIDALLRYQLVLVTKAKADEEEVEIKDDTKKIMNDSFDNEPLTLQLFIHKWSPTQLFIIQDVSRGFFDYHYFLGPNKEETIEAFRWGIDHNPSLKSLVIDHATDIGPIMPFIQHIEKLHLKKPCVETFKALIDVLPRNESIKSLIIENPSPRSIWCMGYNSTGYFDDGLLTAISMSTKNGLKNLTMIRNDSNYPDYDYKMTDLVMLLNSESLRTVHIKGFRVRLNKFDDNDPEGLAEVDGDLAGLAAGLVETKLQSLILSENIISESFSNVGEIMTGQIVSSLQPIMQNITQLNVSPPMLEMRWNK